MMSSKLLLLKELVDGEKTSIDLKERCCMKHGFAVSLLNELIEGGFVYSKYVPPAEGRPLYSLTEKGQEELRKNEPVN